MAAEDPRNPIAPAEATAAATEWEDEDEQTRVYALDPTQPLVLGVVADAGNVVVRAADRRTLLVRSDGDGDGRGTDEDPPGLVVVQRDNTISIEPRRPFEHVDDEAADGAASDPAAGIGRAGGRRRRFRLPFARWAAQSAVDIEVEVPRHLETTTLEVATASGDIEIDGLSGRLTVRSASGNVELDRCDGDLVVNTASGDCSLARLDGSLRVQTASGTVDIDRALLRSLAVRSASGDVAAAHVALGHGEHQVETVSGDVDLSLLRPASGPGAGPIAIGCTTVSGDVDLGPGVLRLRSRMPSTMAPPAAIVRVRTTSGSLSATATEGGDDLAEWFAGSGRPPAPAAPSPDERVGADVANSTALFAATSDLPAPPEIPAPPLAPEAPTPPAARADPETEMPAAPADRAGPPLAAPPEAERARLSILQTLERGDIDVDEAMRRLDDLVAFNASPAVPSAS